MALTMAALGLFFAGTNFCLISALAGPLGAGVPMHCMAAPAAASTPAPQMSHCGHASASAKSDQDPGTPAPLPCCLAYAPVSAPQLPPDPGAAPSVDLFPVAVAVAPAPVPAGCWNVAPAEDQVRPPGTRAPSLHSGRAPPLA
ncbi:MAG: hypothetical protein A2V63_05380 [Candidatus Eisenbacteria bacterium RBG_19FT_COMBO_70_11]|nr:MAG: hypothetical protein A2V63_05380 [Candidatus Eisenbacteria bacterium RBG_19FT_COMBO_70_11]